MTRHDYIISAMVAAGIVTNFLGAAFTIARILSFLKRKAVQGSANGLHDGNFALTEFAFSFSELRMKLKSVRSFREFAEVLERHATEHGIGASVGIVASVMAAAGIMVAAILGW